MDNTSVVRFLAVVDQGNFASAARHLGVTPQALSISIAKLEEELKLTLFDRVPGGITQLTDLGKALVPHARSLVAAERRAIEEVQAIRDARSGWVRIGVGEAMTGSFAAKAISELKREAPDATVAVVEGYVDDLLNRLDQGELDLVAGAPDMRRGHRRPFKQVFLHSSREAVFCRRDHPLVGRPHVSLEDMQSFTWLLPYARKDSYEAVVNSYAEEGLQPPQHVVFSDTATVGLNLLATEDYLLMVTPDLMWPRVEQPHSPFARLNAPKPTIERRACLIYRTDHPLSALAERLRRIIIAHARSPGSVRELRRVSKRSPRVSA